MKALLIVSLALTLLSPSLKADGCYICQGSTNTYVKFSGSDSFEKRKEAEKCGCKVGGTTSSCNAANYKVLCSVLSPAVPQQYAWIVR